MHCKIVDTNRMGTCSWGNRGAPVLEADSWLMLLLHRWSSCKLGTLSCMDTTCGTVHYYICESDKSLLLLPFEEMPATDLRPTQAAFVQDQDAESLIVRCASEFFWSRHCHEVVRQIDTS